MKGRGRGERQKSDEEKSYREMKVFLEEGAPISQKPKIHHIFLGTVRITRSKFDIKDPQLSGGHVQNSVARDLYTPAIEDSLEQPPRINQLLTATVRSSWRLVRCHCIEFPYISWNDQHVSVSSACTVTQR
jgi:hypothetical protein